MRARSSHPPARRSAAPRDARPTKIAALAAGGAVVLAGALVADAFVDAPDAGAVNYLNSWDGVFAKNQLWYKNADDRRIFAADNPGSTADVGAAMLARFDQNGNQNGAPGQSGQMTIGVGPVFKHAGEETIHMVASQDNGNTYVYRSVLEAGKRRVDGIDYGNLTRAPVAPGANETACTAGTRYSAEVNQENGYLYEIPGGAFTSVAGNAARWGFNAAIYRLNQPSGSRGTATCLAGASAMTGTPLRDQWQAATGQTSQPGSWELASDMAIDANGNFYLLLRGDATHHALVRLEVTKDAAGEPTSGEWRFRLVKAFTGNATNNAKYGLAFVDGALYSVIPDSRIHRWDTLAGTVEEVGRGPGNALDLGAAQAAPVIEGTVYNDANGNGAIESGEGGVAGAAVELYHNTGTASAPAWAKRGELTTDSGGNYSALLNAASGQFLVRLARPRVGGANAVQTYANSQVFTAQENGQNVSNTVRPYCAASANYNLVEPSGAGGGVKCAGARLDGIDPASPGDPLAASGGAAIVSRVDMSTDQAVVQADFGVTVAGSWGDAPDSYKTTNGASGPYANPRRGGQPYLFLGVEAGDYADGAPTAQADSHAADDGLELSPTDSAGRATEQWVPAQGQLMATGRTYAFRAKAAGVPDALAGAYVKGWITGLTAAGATEGTFNQALLGGGACSARPDARGYVYCNYTAPSVPPKDGLATVYARVRASLDAGVTATGRGPANPESSPWAPPGEVEDYALSVTGSVLRVEARTLGGVPAYVKVGLGSDNVADIFPSTLGASVLTDKSGNFVSSRSAHALKNRAAATTLTTLGVGGMDPATVDGWALSNRLENGAPVDTWCEDAATRQDLGASVDTATGKVVIPAPAGGKDLPQDITCHLTYAPKADMTTSTVTANPSANQSSPLVAGAGVSQVALKVTGAVRGEDGSLQPSVPAGAEAQFELTPIAGSGATATGARFETSADGGSSWQSAGQRVTCAVAATGECHRRVRVVASIPGGYSMNARIGADYVLNAATNRPTRESPVQIYFKAAAADQAQSHAAITSTAGQQANHNAPGTGQAQWGKQTVTVTLRDSAGLPYEDGAAPGALAAGPAAGGPEGVYYSAASGALGQFACAATPVAGRCAAGVYTLDVYASLAGAKQITVTYTPAAGAPFPILEQGTQSPALRAQFTAPPADPASSVFLFAEPGEATPENNIDDPLVTPDGVGVPHATGYAFHPAIRVWDAGRNNPGAGERVRFRVEDACPAVFLDNNLKAYEAVTSAAGKAQASLRSAVAGSCRVWGELYAGGAWVALPGGDGKPWTKTAQWQDTPADLTKSHFTVSAAPVVADGQAAGKVTVTLIGTGGLPVTTAAASLAAFGPPGEAIAVGAFTHVGSGVYEASFTGTRSGDKAITAQVGGGNLNLAAAGNRLAHMVAGPPAAARSWLAQDPQSATADGKASVPVRLVAFDAAGNVATSGSAVFAIPAGVTADGQAGPGLVTVPVVAGEARVDLTSTLAGPYEVTATLGNQPVMTVKNPAGDQTLASDGVAHAVFTAGAPSPGASRLTIPTAGADGKTTMVVGGAEKHRAEVLVKDANGNLVADGAASVVFEYRYADSEGQPKTGRSQPVPVGKGGVAAWEFGSEAATVWEVQARIAGTLTDVTGSPAAAGFRAGAFDESATLASFEVDQSVKR
ncbi:MAG: hypothetical protein LBL01_08065, partial [Bifidobacteriaceae bacterium]|nr:hypothetical protein [Bifidobacteriaceae bacterium]